MREGKLSEEAQARFLVGIQGSSLLFDKGVAEQFNRIWKDAIELETRQSIFQDLPVGKERSREVRAVAEIKKRLPELMATLDDAVRPYLHLGNVK